MVGVVVLGETGTFGREDEPSHPPGNVGVAPDALSHVEETVETAGRHAVPDGGEGVDGSDPSSGPQGGGCVGGGEGGEEEGPEGADKGERGDEDSPGVGQYPKRVAPHAKGRVEERSRVVVPIQGECLVLEGERWETLWRGSEFGRLSESMVVVDNPMVDVASVEPGMEPGERRVGRGRTLDPCCVAVVCVSVDQSLPDRSPHMSQEVGRDHPDQGGVGEGWCDDAQDRGCEGDQRPEYSFWDSPSHVWAGGVWGGVGGW